MPSDSPLMCLTLLGMDSSFKVPDDPEETAELRQELFDLAFKYLPSLLNCMPRTWFRPV